MDKLNTEHGKKKNGDENSSYYKYEKPSYFFKNWLVFVILIIGAIPLVLIPFSNAYRGTTINAENASQLGDFVGGYLGTILSLGSVALLILTLRDQKESSTIEKFETKYFELIKMHRENVAEIGIGNDFGRKIFVILIREFRSILSIVKNVSSKLGITLNNEDSFVVSYCVLFYGVGFNSRRMLRNSLLQYNQNFVEELILILTRSDIRENLKLKRGFRFTPFEGHQSRLGHYYRHLYQSVKYVDKRGLDIDKYDYVKTIRAQLSTHEQALLFINSLSPQGSPWWNDGFLTRYRLVKNVPPKFFDEETEIDMSSYFPDNYFEWQMN